MSFSIAFNVDCCTFLLRLYRSMLTRRRYLVTYLLSYIVDMHQLSFMRKILTSFSRIVWFFIGCTACILHASSLFQSLVCLSLSPCVYVCLHITMLFLFISFGNEIYYWNIYILPYGYIKHSACGTTFCWFACLVKLLVIHLM